MPHSREVPQGDRTAGETGEDGGAPPSRKDLPATLAQIEREMIIVALREARGNKARAARALGISERLMGLRVNKYDIDPKAFRTSR